MEGSTFLKQKRDPQGWKRGQNMTKETTQNLSTNSFLPAALQQLTAADLGLEKPTKMSFCATSKYNLALEESL